MAEKNEISPKGKEAIYTDNFPNETNEFAERQEFKDESFKILKEVAIETTTKYFKDAGFKEKAGRSGEYGDGTSYGKGLQVNEFNVEVSSRPPSKAYFEKIIYLGANRMVSNININYSGNLTGTGNKPVQKIIEVEYHSSDYGAYTSYAKMPQTNPFINDTSVYNVTSIDSFKKELIKKFTEFAKKEVAYLSKVKKDESETKKGIEESKRLTKMSLVDLAKCNLNELLGNVLNEEMPKIYGKKADAIKDEQGNEFGIYANGLQNDASLLPNAQKFETQPGYEDWVIEDLPKNKIKKLDVKNVNDLKDDQRRAYMEGLQKDWTKTWKTIKEENEHMDAFSAERNIEKNQGTPIWQDYGLNSLEELFQYMATQKYNTNYSNVIEIFNSLDDMQKKLFVEYCQDNKKIDILSFLSDHDLIDAEYAESEMFTETNHNDKELLFAYDPSWNEDEDEDFEWGDFKMELGTLIGDNTEFYVEGRNMGWRNLSGHADISIKPGDVNEFLTKCMPKTSELIIKIYKSDDPLAICDMTIFHHDAPTGEFRTIYTKDAAIEKGLVQPEEEIEEISAAGSGGAGAGAYQTPYAFRKGGDLNLQENVDNKVLNTPYGQMKNRRPTISKTKLDESDSFWTKVELNPGSGYVPKGMEHPYIAGDGQGKSWKQYSKDLGWSPADNKNIRKKKNVNEGVLEETGEWSDDQEGIAWKESLKNELEDIQNNVPYGTFTFIINDIRGFDKYQGPYAMVKIFGKAYKIWTMEGQTLWIENYPVDNTSSETTTKGFQGTPSEIIDMLNEKASEVIKLNEQKRKFMSESENKIAGINKRYLITAKEDEKEQSKHWKRLALHESTIMDNTDDNIDSDCTCYDCGPECQCSCHEGENNLVSMADGQSEDMANFERLNNSIHDGIDNGDEIDGRETIDVPKGGNNLTGVVFRLFKDEFLNENICYIMDLKSGNLVQNPNYKSKKK